MILTFEQIIAFSLILARMVVMILMVPIFSNKEVLSMGKIAIVFWMSTLLIYYVPLPLEFPSTPTSFFFALIVEILIGAILGFITQILLIAVEFGGSLMDTQAGLSVASQLDPSTGQTSTLFAKLLKNTALLVFLLIDGHHIVLGALMNSFAAIPIGSPFKLQKASLFVVESSTAIFDVALQFAAPIILVVFLVDFGFGMLSRVAPQVNVFQLGFQMKPVVSLFIFLSIIPGMVELINVVLNRIAAKLIQTLFLLRL